MKDNNDELIRNFMQSNCKEIEDNGFSERVIRNLPKRIEWLSRILDLLCFTICCILFVAFDGLNYIYELFVELFSTKSYMFVQNVNTTSLFIAFAVCLFIGLERICSLKW